MKKPAFIFFFCFIWIWSIPAQKITGPFVINPVYSDLSKPLSSLSALSPLKKENRKVEKMENEIWNYFRKNLQNNKSKRTSVDPVRQNFFGKIVPDSAFGNFEGTPNVNTAIPPDTYGDVGPNYYFHMVNLSFTIFDKAGNILLGPMNTADIWNGLPYSANNGDGIVLYDDQANRWFISSLCMPNYPSAPYFIMIAVSQTSDPRGAWYRWEYQLDNVPDYPKFGVWGDAYYMSCNRFNQNFLGVGVAAFDRSAMIAGAPSPSMVLFQISQSTKAFSILPADCDGPFLPAGTPGYFGYLDSDFLGIYEFHTNWANPTASTFGNMEKIGVSAYNPLVKGIPQKGSGVFLAPISDRLMCRLQIRKFEDHQSMVVNHTVRITDYQSGIRWYEMRRTTGNWSLYQQSTFAPDTNSRWMGSIAIDSAGNIALGYSVSGPDLYPSIRYTGRMKNDPLGQMTIAEQSIIEGGGAQTHPSSNTARWGDYSSMTVDPSTPTIFWYTQQYYPATADIDWHTRIGSFTFANILDIKAIAAFSNICPGQQDQLDIELSGGTGSYSFSWTSIPSGFTSTLKNPIVSPQVQTKYIVVVTIGNQSRTDTIQINMIPPASVFAGGDTVICRYISDIQLNGQAENYLSVKWLTFGDGTFADPYALYTSYHPGIKDHSNSTFDLELIAYPQPPCPVVSGHRQIKFDTCAGIQPGEGSTSLLIFPNPSRGKFYIDLPPYVLSFEVLDLNGKVIQRKDLGSSKEKQIMIDLINKPGGIYPVKIVMKDRIIRQKLVLE